MQILTSAIPSESSPVYHYSIRSADDVESGVIDRGRAEAPGREQVKAPSYVYDWFR